MDFIVVDTIFNMRFYVYFIIHYQTREIIQFGITRNPVREFVKQQIIDFTENLKQTIYLIHDRSKKLCLNYKDYGIKSIITSIKAPNMNAVTERFIRSIRRECMDWFIIFNEHQLYGILKEYVQYYNSKRPHQGLAQQIPKGYKPQKRGKIVSYPVLYGLHHSYERKAA